MTPNLLLIDSNCMICNGFVQFVIRQDRREKISFAALQSEPGQQILATHNLPVDKLFTAIFVKDGIVHLRSDAILQVLSCLPGWWPVLGYLRLLPASLRDFCYNWFAARRYRWFGQTDSCLLPSPALRKRILG